MKKLIITVLVCLLPLAVFAAIKTSTVHSSSSVTGGELAVGEVYNLTIVPATTTNANDSIKIQCGDSACSVANFGLIKLRDDGDSDIIYTITSDVTIDLTGAHWGQDTFGDLIDAILRVSAIAKGTTDILWCVNLQGGRTVADNALVLNAAASVNLPEEFLCDGTTATNKPIHDSVFWFKANFDDAGGAAANLWAVNSGLGDLNFGSADGQWMDFNSSYGGFSSDPTFNVMQFTQYGKSVRVMATRNTDGASNGTNFTVELPIKAKYAVTGSVIDIKDNGVNVTKAAVAKTTAASRTMNLYTDGSAGTWTAANAKNASFYIEYEAGP